MKSRPQRWIHFLSLSIGAAGLAMILAVTPALAERRVSESFEAFPTASPFRSGLSPQDVHKGAWRVRSGGALRIAKGASTGGRSPNRAVLAVHNRGAQAQPWQVARDFTPIDASDPSTPIAQASLRLHFPVASNNKDGVDFSIFSDAAATQKLLRLRATPTGAADDFQVEAIDPASGSTAAMHTLGLPIRRGYWYELEVTIYLADVGISGLSKTPRVLKPRYSVDVEVTELDEKTRSASKRGLRSLVEHTKVGAITVGAAGTRGARVEIDDVEVRSYTGAGADYSIYANLDDYRSLEAAIADNTHVWVPTGPRTLRVRGDKLPITLDRDAPLYLHGAGHGPVFSGKQSHSALRVLTTPAIDPKALFEVLRIPEFELVGMAIGVKHGTPPTRALEFKNTRPTRFRADSVTFEGMDLNIAGPGDFVLQQVIHDGQATLEVGLSVDHPEAVVRVVTGRFDHDRRTHFHLRRGHLEAYGLSLQGPGPGKASADYADFRIDSRSPRGAHFITGARSEGTNSSTEAGRFLYVPQSAERVDVVVSSNHLSRSVPDTNVFADYNGAGTLWLFGNRAKLGVSHFVTGKAPAATIVAGGNVYLHRKFQRAAGKAAPSEAYLFPIRAKALIHAGTTYDYQLSSGQKEKPYRRLDSLKRNLTGMPPVPRSNGGELLPVVERPKLRAAPPGMLSVRDPQVGAVGDGRRDDHAALQRALDIHGMNLWFPPGTYRITKPLIYQYSKAGSGSQKFGLGGMLAGAGSGRARIVNALGGPVFQTRGTGYATAQGLSFETKAYGETANFDLDNDPKFFDQSQAWIFHDTRFVGGKYGLAIALGSNLQGSEVLCVDCDFAMAQVGAAVGGANALNNFVHRSHFLANDVDIAAGKEGFDQGVFGVLSAVSRGARRRNMEIVGDRIYIHGFDSNAPQILELGCSSHASVKLFERSRFRPPLRGTAQPLRYNASGSLIFLHSIVETKQPFELGCNMGGKVAMRIESEMPPFCSKHPAAIEVRGPADAPALCP